MEQKIPAHRVCRNPVRHATSVVTPSPKLEADEKNAAAKTPAPKKNKE